VIPLSEAQEFVLGSCSRSAPAQVPLGDALGCVAAESVLATEPVPPFVNSSMDGYALRAADTAPAGAGDRLVRLRVVGTVMAGTPFHGEVGPGQAVRIMTGAPLPSGTDAVIPIEDVRTEGDGAVVTIEGSAAPGAFVRWMGQDVALGDTVLEQASVVTPGRIGVLAAQGLGHVSVHPMPRIGVLSTGDELVSGPGPLPPGKIRDANRLTLVALIRQEGWTPIDLGVAGDDERALDGVLDDAQHRCDAIVTSGGVSVGDLDVVKVVLRNRSAGTMRWMQVAIRPAKPLAFGLLDGSGVPVFGLPGNPVSAMVSFELFVRPAARRMSGHTTLHRPMVAVAAEGAIGRRPDGKTHFVRSIVGVDAGGRLSVRSLTGQESHQLTAMAEANALAVLPDGTGVSSGETVSVMLLDAGRVGPAVDAPPEGPA
jgi:molybdopterin molybdotransferase